MTTSLVSKLLLAPATYKEVPRRILRAQAQGQLSRYGSQESLPF